LTEQLSVIATAATLPPQSVIATEQPSTSSLLIFTAASLQPLPVTATADFLSFTSARFKHDGSEAPLMNAYGSSTGHTSALPNRSENFGEQRLDASSGSTSGTEHGHNVSTATGNGSSKVKGQVSPHLAVLQS
jgi:hypothetical protein